MVMRIKTHCFKLSRQSLFMLTAFFLFVSCITTTRPPQNTTRLPSLTGIKAYDVISENQWRQLLRELDLSSSSNHGYQTGTTNAEFITALSNTSTTIINHAAKLTKSGSITEADNFAYVGLVLGEYIVQNSSAPNIEQFKTAHKQLYEIYSGAGMSSESYSPSYKNLVTAIGQKMLKPTTSSTLTYTTYSASYKLSLSRVERPEKATSRYGQQKIDTFSDSKYKYIFEDEMVRILWMVNSRTIAFSVRNNTDHSIKILWDEAAFIDEKGISHRIMHSGVKYTDRSSPQAPSIIVRKSSVEDIVFPVDYVYWSEGTRYSAGEWKERSFFPDFNFNSKLLPGEYSSFTSFEQAAKSNIGKTIQVLLPLQIEDIINDYIFAFTVDDVVCKEETR